jgi:calcineurin-like phosphoesterase family protein
VFSTVFGRLVPEVPRGNSGTKRAKTVENTPDPLLLAISDLHLERRQNRDALHTIGEHPNDWLIVAGDVGNSPDHLALAWQSLTPRFARILWTPGNHELWAAARDPSVSRGQARYDELVSVCRSFGVVTPEDPYRQWPGDPAVFIVPMFLLYDYTFHPPDVPTEHALAWARETGVVCGDERLLAPDPWPSRSAWCHARCQETETRLRALPPDSRTVLINHWPLRYDLARPPRIPRFSIWCGTTLTEQWGRQYRAAAVVSGHLHLRTTLARHGVRYDEVSLGYPRDWRAERGVSWYLREILPGTGPTSQRFVPARDPYRYP